METLNRSMTAIKGAAEVGLDAPGVVAVVQSLKQQDFDKSMTAYASSRVWQDVYRPTLEGKPLYVKFTIDGAGNFLLIGFKEA